MHLIRMCFVLVFVQMADSTLIHARRRNAAMKLISMKLPTARTARSRSRGSGAVIVQNIASSVSAACGDTRVQTAILMMRSTTNISANSPRERMRP